MVCFPNSFVNREDEAFEANASPLQRKKIIKKPNLFFSLQPSVFGLRRSLIG